MFSETERLQNALRVWLSHQKWFCTLCQERHSVRIVFRVSHGRRFVLHVSVHKITLAFEVKLHSHAHTHKHTHSPAINMESLASFLFGRYGISAMHIYVVLFEIVWNWKMAKWQNGNHSKFRIACHF